MAYEREGRDRHDGVWGLEEPSRRQCHSPGSGNGRESRAGGKVQSPVLDIAFECLRAIRVVDLGAAQAWYGLEEEMCKCGK